MREFSSGATRDNDTEKIDFEGFLNPLVLQAFGEYMHHHRKQADGKLRDSDNWQSLFGDNHYDVCIKSAWRHFHDLCMEHRGYKSREGIDAALGGLIFNAMAYWLKILLEREEQNEKNHGKSN